MVDVVGLRFVTEGQKEALASLALYENGIRNLTRVQDRHVAEMNRARREEVQAFALNQRLKQRYMDEEARARQQDMRAFALVQRMKEQALREEARAQAEATRAAERAAADRQRALQQEFQAFARIQRMKEQALQEEQAAQAALARETEALARAYNPVLAAVTVYEQRVQQLNRAHQLGVLTNDQLQAELAQTAAAYNAIGQDVNRASAFVNNFSAANTFAGRQMNGTGMAMQQVGYQVGDFLVQWQSGTNVLVAFGQQATQLVGILPMMGAGFMGLSTGALVALSAGLGIAIPLVTAIGAAFMRTSSAARNAAQDIDVLAERVQRAAREIADMAFEIDAMRRGFEDFQEFALVRAIEQAQERVSELTRQIYELQQIGTVTGPNERELAAAQETLRLLREQLETYVRQREEHENLSSAEERRLEFSARLLEVNQGIADAFRDFAEYANEFMDAFKTDQLDAAAQLEEKLNASADAALQAALEAAELKRELNDAKRQAELLAAVNIKRGIDAAANSADRLADRLRLSLLLAGAIAGGAGGGAGRGEGPQGPTREDLLRNNFSVQLAEAAAFGTGPQVSDGGGGGGGGADAFTSRIEGIRALQDQIAAAAEQTRLYEQEVSLLDSALENGIITQQRYNELLMQAQEAYGQALTGAYDYTSALESVNDRAMKSMEDAIMGIVNGSQTATEAFRNMAQQILNEAFRLLVVRPLMQSLFGGGGAPGGLIGNLIGGAFANANGNAFMGGNVIPFANGGVVGGPTLFPMSGGQTGLMGEAGPEAIMPLKRTKGGKLGVVAESAPSVNVTVTMDPSTGALGAFVRNESGKIIASAAPQIIEASKGAMTDTIQRGGATARVFR